MSAWSGSKVYLNDGSNVSVMNEKQRAAVEQGGDSKTESSIVDRQVQDSLKSFLLNFKDLHTNLLIYRYGVLRAHV